MILLEQHINVRHLLTLLHYTYVKFILEAFKLLHNKLKSTLLFGSAPCSSSHCMRMLVSDT